MEPKEPSKQEIIALAFKAAGINQYIGACKFDGGTQFFCVGLDAVEQLGLLEFHKAKVLSKVQTLIESEIMHQLPPLPPPL